MQTLQMDEKTAGELYQEVGPVFKKVLEENFPSLLKTPALTGSIIDRTPTVEAALAIAGTTIEALTRPTDAPHETAGRIIETVIEVLREDVEVRHSDDDQTKYEPRFIYKPGVGLSSCVYARWNTHTGCGPRLCYLSYDTMIHGVKILEPYYITYINFK